MRRRITYVHGPGDAFDPSQLSLSSDTLSVTNLHAAKEERLTFGFSELPEEVRELAAAENMRGHN